MQKGQRKRGRRAEKKQKERETEEVDLEIFDEPTINGEQFYDGNEASGLSTFFGLLSEEELEYFRRADELLEVNDFGDDENRVLFIENLYKEVSGKELKLAHSQGCSRLLERLILKSGPAQLKQIFQAFSGHFFGCIQHRFASHCCETLFIQCAPIVTKEMDPDDIANGDASIDSIFASMESLFLHMLAEIEPYFRELLPHRFASHTVRTILLLFWGKPVSSVQRLVQSRKKENIKMSLEGGTVHDEEAACVYVPESFRDAQWKLLAAVNQQHSIDELRSLAVHQIGSPALQICLQLEMSLPRKEHRRRAKCGELLLTKLTGVNGSDENKDVEQVEVDLSKDSAGFFKNLLYDFVGSHLAESIVRHAPKNQFKTFYRMFIKERIGSLVRNETAAFVVQRVLTRLGKGALEEALKDIRPQTEGLITKRTPAERSRIAVLKTLIDSCAKHEIDTNEFLTAITSAYENTGESSTPLILKMLNVTSQELVIINEKVVTVNQSTKQKNLPAQRHGSLLVQAMLSLPGEFSNLIIESLLSIPSEELVALCKHSTGSHAVQKILGHSPPARRRVLNTLRGRFAELAQHIIASHIVDEAWDSPMNYRQSIAEELLRAEPQLRGSYPGRAVWRNWSMDRFKTARRMWYTLSYETELHSRKTKTAIELARERHATGGGQGTTGSLGKNKRPGEGISLHSKKQRVV